MKWDAKLLMILLFSVMLGACSSSSTTEEADSDAIPSADSDTDMIPDDSLAELQNTDQPPSLEEPSQENMAKLDESPAPEATSDDSSSASAAVIAPVDTSSGSTSSYQIKEGDTLMKIAFENYGNVYDWKKIYERNRDKIPDKNNLVKGTELTIDAPSTPVQIEKNGTPYLIKGGDTLGTISHDVYGTPKKWQRLHENNRQLVRNPNKIYAGFYLYYTFTSEDEQEKQNFLGSVGKDAREPSATSAAPVMPTEAPTTNQ